MLSDICKNTAAGVYSITNIETGKRYIGSTHNFRNRNYTHVRTLRLGCGNKKLQYSFNKHGIEKFVFEILLICKKEACLFYEELVIFAFNSVKNGYNLRHIPYSNIGLKLPQSEESKRKIGNSNLGKRLGCIGNMSGKKQSESAKRKMSTSKRQIFTQYEYDGKKMCLSDWADYIGISVNGLQNRISRGWPIDRALTEKSRGY